VNLKQVALKPGCHKPKQNKVPILVSASNYRRFKNGRNSHTNLLWLRKKVLYTDVTENILGSNPSRLISTYPGCL